MAAENKTDISILVRCFNVKEHNGDHDITFVLVKQSYWISQRKDYIEHAWFVTKLFEIQISWFRFNFQNYENSVLFSGLIIIIMITNEYSTSKYF